MEDLLAAVKIDAKHLQRRLMKWLIKPHNIVFTNNMSWLLAFEADVICVNKNHRITEFEIKISRSDFKADFCKAKHVRFAGGSRPVFKHNWLQGESIHGFLDQKRPNYFYFVTPKGLLRKDEIPAHVGLIEIDNEEVVVVKRPPLLHETIATHEMILSIARNSCIKLSSAL